jgi:hypothetical protein
MRRLLLCGMLVACAASVAFGQTPASTSDEGDRAISHGDFAVLIVKAISTPQEAVPDPETALDRLKRIGIVPTSWEISGLLTQGELADVLARMGIFYEPSDRGDRASRAFVIVLLRREMSKLRDYLARRTGHGFSQSHVLDEGVDRAVSPDRP